MPGPRAQAAVFGAGLAGAAAVHVALAPGLIWQLALLSPAVAILGLPHGALDLPMAETLWPLHGPADRVRFFAAYLGLVAGVVALWWLAPGAALAAFLSYSAWHFSGDWEDADALRRAAGGAAVIGAPALFHQTEVAAIFAYLVPDNAAEVVAQAAAGAGLATAAVFAATLLDRAGRIDRPALEQAGLWAGGALLPPLMFFVVYFCLLHSLRHFAETLPAVRYRQRALWQLAGVMAVALVGACLAGGALMAFGAPDAETATLRVVFVGLAALTVPHMLLVERFDRMRRARRMLTQKPATDHPAIHVT